MPHAQGYILVSRHQNATHANFHAALHRHGGSSVGALHPNLRAHRVKVPVGQEKALADSLSQDPDVEFAEVDEVTGPTAVLNDPLIASSWHLAKVGAPIAWDRADGSGVVVAVLDGGVQADHPDLATNVLPGWNVYDNNALSADVTGHGTAVAGVIGAVGGNGLGGAGVAYRAKILPIRASDPVGNGTFSSAASAIMWASDHGAHIVSASWANLYKSSTVIAASQAFRTARNGIVVVSANNNGIDEGSPKVDSMIVVSGTNPDDTFWASSSWGPMVSVCAPAVNILCTLWHSSYNSPGYGAVGTSFATPIVSGVLALIKQLRPDLTAAQQCEILTSSSVDLGGLGYDTKFGYGRVSASGAVSRALAYVAPVVTPAPTPTPTPTPAPAPKKHGHR